MQVFKRSAVPFGTYNTKCTEGTVPQQAFEKRVFNRTKAFRQAQKPINVRLAEREEQQFSTMPMSSATFVAGRAEAMGTCYRVVTPSSVAEDYMAAGVRAQLTAKAHPSGVYRVGVCEDGYAKGDAENLRVAALAAEYRAAQQSASAVTGQQYESARTARKLYASSCHHEETQIYAYPAVAAAMCRD
ncbi:R-phycoerythrin gamma subunit [Gracilaria domingensis]|nr:R-phycoerythrin gamma subunit [Gracilaria domingensis]